MEAHRCKLCSRSFLSGRALGGHMKSHLAPRPTPTLSSTSPDVEAAAIYGLRENPQKSIKFSDPIVQDGESEAESRDRRRTSRRKRSGRRIGGDDNDGAESPEAEQPVSSVSDISLEEDVAMCLMMLSRDDGSRNPAKDVVVENGVADSAAQRKQHRQCEICKKWFRSSQALGGHRIIHRKKVVSKEKKKQKSCVSKRGPDLDDDDNDAYVDESSRVFECPFCGKVFGSGQALGGHKRSHLKGCLGRSPSSSGVAGGAEVIKDSYIDLNMPPSPVEEDEDVYSVVSIEECGGGGGGPTNYYRLID